MVKKYRKENKEVNSNYKHLKKQTDYFDRIKFTMILDIDIFN